MADRLIHGKQFLNWLKAAGVVPERTIRVVIEASVRGAVCIYAELYGSEGMVEVDPPEMLRGAEVVMVGQENAGV